MEKNTRTNKHENVTELLHIREDPVGRTPPSSFGCKIRQHVQNIQKSSYLTYCILNFSSV